MWPIVQYSLEIYFFPFCQPQKYILDSQEMCNVNKNVNLFTSSAKIDYDFYSDTHCFCKKNMITLTVLDFENADFS